MNWIISATPWIVLVIAVVIGMRRAVRADRIELDTAHAAMEKGFEDRAIEGALIRRKRQQERVTQAMAWAAHQRSLIASEEARPRCATCGRRNPAHPRSRIRRAGAAS